MLEITQSASSGSDLGSVIAGIIANDAIAASRKGQLTAEAFQKVVRRGLGSTGSFYRQRLAAQFKDNWMNVEEVKRHPLTGVQMGNVIKKLPPKAGGHSDSRMLSAYSQPERKPGSRFRGIIEYVLREGSGLDLDVEAGAVRSDKGGKRRGEKWNAYEILKDWQEAGTVNPRRSGGGNMHRYLAAIGLPMSQGFVPRRPKRAVLETLIKSNDPVQEFTKRFTERLYK